MNKIIKENRKKSVKEVASAPLNNVSNIGDSIRTLKSRKQVRAIQGNSVISIN